MRRFCYRIFLQQNFYFCFRIFLQNCVRCITRCFFFKAHFHKSLKKINVSNRHVQTSHWDPRKLTHFSGYFYSSYPRQIGLKVKKKVLKTQSVVIQPSPALNIQQNIITTYFFQVNELDRRKIKDFASFPQKYFLHFFCELF